MQKTFTLIGLSILLIAGKSTGFKTENKEITKTYVHVPAKDATHKGFYISSIEITNKQYRDFLNDLKAKGENDKLKRAMIDTSIQKTFLPNVSPSVADYFFSSAKNNYPVVNVTEEGALLYCDWLTEKYNLAAKIKVRFTLPNEDQWTTAAQGGDTHALYPWKGNSLTIETRSSEQVDICNYKHQAITGKTYSNNEKADITAPSLSYTPNAYGIYNMAGNVAEIIVGASYTKGGSWVTTYDKITIASHEDYPDKAHSAPTIGFRPIMLVPDGE